MIDDIKTSAFSRRGFLAGTGVIALGLVAAACGSDSSSDTASSDTTGGTTATTAATPKVSAGDAKVATTAAGLEFLAVGTYKAALDAATAGKLGAVAPAVGEFVKTAMDHHQQALDKWNGVLTANGAQAVTAPPADLKSKVDTAFGQVKDQAGAAKLALMLESIASNTYLAALPSIENKDAVLLAAQLQVVDQEHAAILHFVLGEYPVPDTFQKTDQAYAG